MKKILSIILMVSLFIPSAFTKTTVFAQNTEVMMVSSGGKPEYFNSFEAGWIKAVESSKNNETVVTLLSDWYAGDENSNGIIDSGETAGYFKALKNGVETGTNSGRLYIDAENTKLTIDLNGHVLSRNLENPVQNGEVLSLNAGTLTIKDSSSGKTGKITGGNNEARGGGLCVNEGNLYFESGEISGNKSAGNGGGIYWTSYGILCLTGGRITQNKATGEGFGGGIFARELGEIYVGGTIDISGNTKDDGSADNLFLGFAHSDLNQAMGQKKGIPYAPLKEGANICMSAKDNDIFSDTDSMFGLKSFEYFTSDKTTHYIRTVYDAEGKNNTYQLHYTTRANNEVARGFISSVSVKNSSLLKNASLDRANQVITLTAINTKKNAFNFVSLDSLITYELNERFVNVIGAEDVRDLLSSPQYKVCSGDNTYILCTVKVVPFGGEWAEEQESVENNFVATVSDGDRFQAYTDFGEGWTNAIQLSKNLETTITLMSDWVAPNGKFYYKYDGDEYGTDNGRLHLNTDSIKLVIDLNGYTINRNLSAPISHGQVFRIEDGSLTIKDSSEDKSGKITGGNNDGNGGAFYIDRGSLSIEGGQISGNKAQNGGGVYALNSNDTFICVSGGKITENTASANGGGIFMYNGSLYVEGGQISRNNAQNGGGIYWESRDILALTGGEITDNNAQVGAGVYIEDWGKKYVGGTVVVSGNKRSEQEKDNVYLEATDVDLNHAMGQSEAVPYAPLEEGAYIGLRSTEENDLISASDSMFSADSFKYFHGDDSNYFVRSVYDKNGGNNTYKLYYNTWGYNESKYPRVTGVAVKDENILETASINYDTQVITLNAYKHRKASFDNISLDSLISYTLNAQDTFICNSDVPCEITSGMEYMTMSSNGTYVMCTIEIEWVDCKHKDEDENYVCDNCGEYTLTEFKITGYNEQTQEATVFAPEAGRYSLIFADYENSRFANADIVEYDFKEGINVIPQAVAGFTLSGGDKLMLWKDMIDVAPVCDALILK